MDESKREVLFFQYGEGLYFVEDKTLYLSIPKEKVGEVTLRADGFMHLIVSAQ